MKTILSSDLPALLSFPEASLRKEGWCRFAELAATGGTLRTLAEMRKDERFFLSFDLHDEKFQLLAARATCVETDQDGYQLAEFEFLNPLERRRLSETILDLLSRG